MLNLYLDGVSHAGAEIKETASLALGEVILLSDAAVLEKDRNLVVKVLCLFALNLLLSVCPQLTPKGTWW